METRKWRKKSNESASTFSRASGFFCSRNSAKMIRMMSGDPAAYRKFVEVLERLEDEEKVA
ncbi:MAG: hypothetical protein ACKV22_06825 [Bryobacteraceae bacterium]